MLSRFRMTVDDCIKEYQTLGAKVFGHPRPLAKGAILWHKFDYRTLEAVIKDVTQRYSEPGEFGGNYAMNEDVCKWYDHQPVLPCLSADALMNQYGSCICGQRWSGLRASVQDLSDPSTSTQVKE